MSHNGVEFLQFTDFSSLEGSAPETLDTPNRVSLAKFNAIDWDFRNRKTHSEIEGLHPYPAKFITELPRALLDILPVPEGTCVFDPFCGSGTTLVECQRLSLPSVGVDLNPIACLISRVKTQPLGPELPAVAQGVVSDAMRMKSVNIPEIPNLDHWFTKPIQRALASLTATITDAPPEYHDALRLALSSIIVRVSNQDSDTRYAAVEKDITHNDVFVGFQRSVLRINDVLTARSYPLSETRVLEADTLTLSNSQIAKKVGLVITSPPYPNAYEYWLYHKYRMWWLGFDPIAVKEKEIGARAHFFKQNHHTADDFVRQMTETFRLLSQVMVTGGYACFVVGRSKIHGKIIDNAAIVEKVSAGFGFQQVFFTDRVLCANRKSFNLSHANIKTETIMILCLGENLASNLA